MAPRLPASGVDQPAGMAHGLFDTDEQRFGDQETAAGDALDMRQPGNRRQRRIVQDVAGLQVLVEGMRKAGYGEDLITRIAHGNWLSVLERTLQQQDVAP